MKKKLLFLIILGAFLWMPNVYADEINLEVCSHGCEFSSLDDALEEAENYHASNNDDLVKILVSSSGTYTVSDHELDVPVDVFIDEDDIIVDGEGSTITTNYYIGFVSNNEDTFDFTLLGLNIEYVDLSYNTIIYFEGFHNLDVSNVSVINTNAEDLESRDYFGSGIGFYDNGTTTVNQVVVKGFYNGIEGEGSIVITNSDLLYNLFSLEYYEGVAKIKNTTVSNLYNSGGTIRFDLNDDRKIIIKDFRNTTPEQNDAIWDDLYDSYDDEEYNDYVRLLLDWAYGNVMQKSVTLDSTGVDLLNVWFKRNQYELDDFDLDISDESVVSIKDGVVKPLKNGVSIITLTDLNNNIEYRLNVTVQQTLTNPKTSQNILLGGIILIILSSLFFVLRGKKRQYNGI